MKQSYTTYFAEIYDDVMKNVPYKYWFRYLKDLLKYYKAEPNSVLELAAGTGNMTSKLININSVEKITAIDLSAAMLTKAAEKLEILAEYSSSMSKFKIERDDMKFDFIDDKKREIRLEFKTKNMIKFSFEERYDLILSFFDSLNYLTDIDKLQSSFESAAAALNDNGLFIFDMNSVGRIKRIEEESYVIEGEDYSCFWEDVVRAEENLWQVQLKICPDNDEIPCFEELHNERAYKIETIIRLLKNSGFKAVKVFNAFSMAQGKNNSDRLYFVAALDENRLKNNQGAMRKLYYGIKNRMDYFLVSLKYLF